MAWGDVGRSGSGLGRDSFVTLAEGTVAVVHALFRAGEEPHSYFQHFLKVGDTSGRSVNCPGSDNGCPACAAGEKARARHAFNVYDYGSKAVKVLELGNQAMESIKNLFDANDGTLDNLDLIIKRTGSGLATKYVVSSRPAKNSFNVDELNLFDLPELISPHDAAYITAVIEGRDPRLEFNPGEFEIGGKSGETIPEEEPAVLADTLKTRPIGGKGIQSPKQSAKPAIGKPANGNGRSPTDRVGLIKAISENFIKLPRYKTGPKAQVADMERINRKKSTLSQFSLDELQKLFQLQTGKK